MGAYFELTNYKPENIQIIGFLDLETKKYIFFDFLPGKYSQVPNPSSYGPKYLLRFKNEPKFKSDNLKLQEVDKLSKLSKEDRLEYIDRQIKDYERKSAFKSFHDLFAPPQNHQRLGLIDSLFGVPSLFNNVASLASLVAIRFMNALSSSFLNHDIN